MTLEGRKFRIPKIPEWERALGFYAPEAVVEVFRQALQVMPLSHAELGQEMGVAQSTVTRWAGGTQPSLETMIEAIGIIEARMAEVQERIDRAGRALRMAQEVVGLARRAQETGKPADRRRKTKVYEELTELLGDDLGRIIAAGEGRASD